MQHVAGVRRVVERCRMTVRSEEESIRLPWKLRKSRRGLIRAATMKRLTCVLIAVLVAGTLAYTHDGFDHVRGVIKAITEYTVTVEAEDKTNIVLAVTFRTTLRRSGKRILLKDLRVDDKVLVEVPKGTTEASEIEIELPKKTPPSSVR
jgi:cell division septal protein FtsQ